ncbi:HK97 gp10 family phage protein [Corynebacterium senegalense]|uniref:HK97 gp10 family phage protein n=1 Tax=Corynebacterium senegalense TaxID=2080750 RepID=UPI001FE9EFEA|nr:HK97 gp10 family phage protein [Corynebacterium senegalense]
MDLKQLRDANREAARSILPIAIGMAPVGTPPPPHWNAPPPGRLKASLRVAATNRAGIVRAGRKAIPYAGVIHWGWPARHIRPHPWIMRAAQDNENVWMRVYMDHIDDILDQIKGI